MISVRKKIKFFLLYSILFFVLNIWNTYFLTIQKFNRYIAPFPHTFWGEFNALVGNFSMLFIILMLSFLVFKNLKNRMKFMLYFTLILNLAIFAIGVFNKFYGASFSLATLVMFKNPADGFAVGIIGEIFLELITYYRILVFLPFMVLLILFLRSERNEFKLIKHGMSLKRRLIVLMLSILMLFTSFYSYFEQFQHTLPIKGTQSTFAQQNFGVYPFLFSDLLSLHPSIHPLDILKLETEKEIFDAYQAYNKNQTSYINFFDGNLYTNRLTFGQAVPNLYVDPVIKKGDDLQGILKGKNLVLVHVESMNYFLFQNEYTNARMPFFNDLLSQSFVFRNFYNNVGMGVSSDAELSILTGLLPSGDETLYWEHSNRDYTIDSLVKWFNKEGFYTEAIHGDKKTFYNRDIVYPTLYEFDNFYALEDYIQDGYLVKEGFMYDKTNQKVHISPWISDFHLADDVYKRGLSHQENNVPFMMFPIMMMPHTPYDFDPYGWRTDIYPKNYEKELSKITLKYLNYVDYYDDIMKRMFMNEDGEDQTLDNTVYIFYSDHGSGLKNGDLNLIMNKQLSVLEERQILQQTLSFIYVPGTEVVDYGNYSIRKGLLTGDQMLVRSEIDLYRTIIELFDLPVGNSPYYGVHGLSVEPTFALENRLMDVALDHYFYPMRNPKITYPKDMMVPAETTDYILRFKLLSDYLISTGDMQTTIHDIMKKYGS